MKIKICTGCGDICNPDTDFYHWNKNGEVVSDYYCIPCRRYESKNWSDTHKQSRSLINQRQYCRLTRVSDVSNDRYIHVSG